jgi:hypothetical protein
MLHFIIYVSFRFFLLESRTCSICWGNDDGCQPEHLMVKFVRKIFVICFDVQSRLRNAMEIRIQDERPPTSIFRAGSHAKAKLRF